MNLSELKDGFYCNISDEVYFSDKSRVNHSALKKVLLSKGSTVKLFEQDTITQEMRFGTAFHTLILEPEKFKERFELVGDVDYTSKEGRALKEKFRDCVFLEEKGRTNDKGKKIVIRLSDFIRLEEMEHALRYDINNNKTKSCQLLDNCVKKEFVILFTHLGIPCKAKFDGLTADFEIIDLKTTKSCEQDNFENTVFNSYYDTQSVFYKIALKHWMVSQDVDIEPEFYFLAVEKDGAMLSQIYQTNQWDNTAKQLIDAWLPVVYQAMINGNKTTYYGLDQNRSEQVVMRDWHSRKREELLTGRN